MRNRKGTSLIEALVFFAVGCLVLAMIAQLHVRLTRHDTWNASRLSSIESLVVCYEQILMDLSCSASGAVAPTTEGDGLSIERASDGDRTVAETIRYERAPRRSLNRAGRPLLASRLDDVRFRWADASKSVLDIKLVSAGDRIESSGTVSNQPLALEAQVQIASRAQREEFRGWSDGE